MIKPWHNDVYPLPTKQWNRMNQSERNRESMRRSIEERMLREGCVKVRLKHPVRCMNNSKKGDEFYFQYRICDIGFETYLISKDGSKYDSHIYVRRKDFDFVDEEKVI